MLNMSIGAYQRSIMPRFPIQSNRVNPASNFMPCSNAPSQTSAASIATESKSLLERYCPTSKYDYETGMLVPNLNFFSDLMAEQAELAKTGESKLTQEEIEEYSGKCDMTQMSREERNDFLNFLADKGIIDRPLFLDREYEIQASRPGEHGAWIVAEGAEAEAKWGEHADLGPRGVVLFLSPSLDEMYKELLAEQAATAALRSTGRLV